MRNVPEFAEAFNCPKGSPVSPMFNRYPLAETLTSANVR